MFGLFTFMLDGGNRQQAGNTHSFFKAELLFYLFGTGSHGVPIFSVQKQQPTYRK